MNQSISDKKIGVAVSVTNGAAGTSAINGETVDTANAEGVMFLVQLGAIVSGAVTSVNLAESADGSTWTDVAGTSISIADDDDEQVRYLDYHRPAQRYVRLEVARATQNATLSATYALYGVKAAPFTQPTGTEGVAVAA